MLQVCLPPRPHALDSAQQLPQHPHQPHHHHWQPQAKEGKTLKRLFQVLIVWLFFLSDDFKHNWQVFVRKGDPGEVWVNSVERSDDIHDERRVPKTKVGKSARLEGWVLGLQLDGEQAQWNRPRDEEIFWTKQPYCLDSTGGPQVYLVNLSYHIKLIKLTLSYLCTCLSCDLTLLHYFLGEIWVNYQDNQNKIRLSRF